MKLPANRRNDRLAAARTALRDDGGVTVEQLYDAERDALERLIVRHISSRAEAQELIHEAFIKLIRVLAVEKIDNPRAFLYRVATNLSIDWLRDRKRRVQQYSALTGMDADNVVGVGRFAISVLEEQVHETQQAERIIRLLGELAVNCQRAFILHKFKDMTYEEIAREMGVARSTVEKYISRSLLHLRNKL